MLKYKTLCKYKVLYNTKKPLGQKTGIYIHLVGLSWSDIDWISVQYQTSNTISDKKQFALYEK